MQTPTLADASAASNTAAGLSSGSSLNTTSGMASSTTPNTAPQAQEGQLTEWLLRAFAVLLLAFIVVRWGYAWVNEPARLSLLFLLVAESYTLLLVLFARRASQRDMSMTAMLATTYAMGFMLLLEPQGTLRLLPEWAGVGLQALSIAWQFTAKVYLGRSFGLLPAQRGLVMKGPYRFVRHPIYFGYLVGHVGFLLVNFSWQNALVLGVLYAAQVVRIQREEAVLAQGDGQAAGDYRHYQARVRWRLLPFVY
jgi:protein-S-isoprenylcysteine O-methyltransferase Ste14